MSAESVIIFVLT